MTDLSKLEWTEVPCALCGERDARAVGENRAYSVPLSIVRCAACGHVYLSPRPADDSLADLYDEDYYTGAGDYTYADDRAVPEIADLRAKARLKRIEELAKPGDLLELGCSFGAFLLAARDRGWIVRGVDLSDVAVATCRERGLDVVHGTLATAGIPDASTDVVYLSETVEHLPDPRETVRAAAAALRPGGLIVIGTANHDSLARKLRGAAWGYYMPGHLQYFSARSLARLLREEGFEIARRRFGDDRSLADLRAIRRLDGRSSGPRAWLADAARRFHVVGFSLGAGMLLYGEKRSSP
ncbi:MAG: class I SAM-dependent methyltransferase [Planctomycetota bacterium]